MSKIRIVFDEKYYEYNWKNLQPDIYFNLKDNDLIILCNKRLDILKNIESNAAANEKHHMDLYAKRVEVDFGKLNQIESEIATLSEGKGIAIPWFQPTVSQNAKDIEIPKDESVFICIHCERILDSDIIFDFENRSDEDIMNNVCPFCKKKEAISSVNIHLHRAEKLKNEYLQADNLEMALYIQDQIVEELSEVNDFDEDILDRATLEIALSHQTKARLLLDAEETTKAFDEESLAIPRWEEAERKGGFYEYNVSAMGYVVRQACLLKLNKDLEVVIQDGVKAEECLRKYFNLQKITYENKSKKFEDSASLGEYQAVSMMNYLNVIRAMQKLNKNESDIDKYTQKTKSFLASCNKIDNEDRQIFNHQLAFLTQSTSKPVKQKEGCYIATAVYGNYDDPSVLVLRRFRDDCLKQSWFGRGFVKIYYKLSPAIARRLKTTKYVNSVIRNILNCFVACLSKHM